MMCMVRLRGLVRILSLRQPSGGYFCVYAKQKLPPSTTTLPRTFITIPLSLSYGRKMDPVTIVSLVATCATLATKAATAANSLDDFVKSYRAVDRSVYSLATTLRLFSESLSQLQGWLEGNCVLFPQPEAHDPILRPRFPHHPRRPRRACQ